MGKDQFKIVLLTVLTLSAVAIALIELSGISRNSLSDRFSKGSCEKVAAMLKTDIQFLEPKFDFGTVPQGKVMTHSFRYKNTGSEPLLICKADVSCGCTVPKFSEDAVAPGAEGVVVVEFNTAGKTGFQKKNIIVHSNALMEAVSISVEADVH